MAARAGMMSCMVTQADAKLMGQHAEQAASPCSRAAWVLQGHLGPQGPQGRPQAASGVGATFRALPGADSMAEAGPPSLEAEAATLRCALASMMMHAKSAWPTNCILPGCNRILWPLAWLCLGGCVAGHCCLVHISLTCAKLGCDTKPQCLLQPRAPFQDAFRGRGRFRGRFDDFGRRGRFILRGRGPSYGGQLCSCRSGRAGVQACKQFHSHSMNAVIAGRAPIVRRRAHARADAAPARRP